VPVTASLPEASPELGARLDEVRSRIEAAGPSGDVRIVAVTKGFGVDVVDLAQRAGIDDIGENYAQELFTKAAEVGADRAVPVRWHFLGSPQRNKIPRLAPLVALWQGIDRVAAIDRLADVRPGAAILVQVNVVGDPAKAGCAPDGAGTLVDHARDAGLDVRGLMCVGPAGDPDGTRLAFASLADLARTVEVGEVSMGMSDDFEAAVAAGSTMVRLGRVLFGPRPGRADVRR
jgi:pyridoxal phosphate enzyme (YggS family)